MAVGGAMLASRAAVAHAQPGRSLEGSWMLDVNVLTTGTRRSTLLTFTPDGGVVTTGSDHPTRSPGFGSWVRSGEGEFVATWGQLVFDQEGKYVGKFRNRLRMTLNEAGDRLELEGQPETFDLEGNLLTSNRTQTVGARILAEPPDA
jgi:hypothetical protein